MLPLFSNTLLFPKRSAAGGKHTTVLLALIVAHGDKRRRRIAPGTLRSSTDTADRQGRVATSTPPSSARSIGRSRDCPNFSDHEIHIATCFRGVDLLVALKKGRNCGKTSFYIGFHCAK